MSGLGLDLGIGLARGPATSPYSPQAQAYFAAMAAQPDAARKALINDLINGLIADGVWARLDCLFLLASGTEQAGLLNAVNPAQTAAAVSGPTFTADRGFATDGAASYVDTGFNPATAAGLFSQNSACFGIWVNTDQQTTGSLAGWYDGGVGVWLNPRNGSDNVTGLLNQGGSAISAAAPGSTAIGATSIIRATSTAVRLTRNGASLGPGSAASAAMNNNDLYLGRGSASGYAAARFAACWIGEQLFTGQATALYNRLDTYLTAIGGAS